MSVIAQIFQSYTAPGDVIRRLLAMPRHEGRLLVILMAGCAMIFISSLPYAMAQPGEAPADARFAAGLFAWLAVAPLAFYIISGLIQLVRGALKWPADGYRTRLALFWSVLAATPLWLANGVAMSLPVPAAQYAVGIVALLGFLMLVTRNLSAAHGAP